MIEAKNLQDLRISLKRIFAIPITKTTFREVHKAVFTNLKNSHTETKDVMEMLLTGKCKEEIGDSQKLMNILIDEFSVPILVSKEIEGHGELLSFINSQIIKTAQEQCILLNTAKTVDGKELNFLTDLETTAHLTEHFAKRLEEFANATGQPFPETVKNAIQRIKSSLDKF